MPRTNQLQPNTASHPRRRVKGSVGDDGRKPATTAAPRTRQRQKPEDPWMKIAGTLADDPTFVPMTKWIYRKYRAGDYEE